MLNAVFCSASQPAIHYPRTLSINLRLILYWTGLWGLLIDLSTGETLIFLQVKNKSHHQWAELTLISRVARRP